MKNIHYYAVGQCVRHAKGKDQCEIVVALNQGFRTVTHPLLAIVWELSRLHTNRQELMEQLRAFPINQEEIDEAIQCLKENGMIFEINSNQLIEAFYLMKSAVIRPHGSVLRGNLESKTFEVFLKEGCEFEIPEGIQVVWAFAHQAHTVEDLLDDVLEYCDEQKTDEMIQGFMELLLIGVDLELISFE